MKLLWRGRILKVMLELLTEEQANDWAVVVRDDVFNRRVYVELNNGPAHADGNAVCVTFRYADLAAQGGGLPHFLTAKLSRLIGDLVSRIDGDHPLCPECAAERARRASGQ